jgi:hypothetical protein
MEAEPSANVRKNQLLRQAAHIPDPSIRSETLRQTVTKRLPISDATGLSAIRVVPTSTNRTSSPSHDVGAGASKFVSRLSRRFGY